MNRLRVGVANFIGLGSPPPEFNRVDWVEVMDMRHASFTQRAVRR